MRGPKAASWVAVLALVGSLALAGAPAEAAAPSVSATPRHSRAAATDPGTLQLGKGIGPWLLDKAGGAGASAGISLVLSVSGLNQVFSPDPNAAVLREIQRQLLEIQNEIRDLRTSLDGLIQQLAEDNLQRQLEVLRDNVTTPLSDLYRSRFEAVVDAAEEYADAREHNPARITPTYDELIQRRNDFLVAFDRCCTTAATQIHSFLTPGPGSVLASLGRVLAGRHRYLTTDDSIAIRNLYHQFAEWEALAAWMKMERSLPAADPDRVPAGTPRGSLRDYNLARNDYLGYQRSEAQNVVPVIPRNVVIDGSTAASPTSLLGARMYLPAATGLTYRPGVDVAGTVPRTVIQVNARYAEGFDDWRVPTRPELTQLLTGRPTQPNTTATDFLRSLNPTSLAWGQIVGGTWTHLWSSADYRSTTNCWIYVGSLPVRDRNHPVHTHTAVSIATTSPTWSPRPVVSPTGPSTEPRLPTDPSVCGVWLSSLFAANTGALLATRTIDTTRIDYLARGTGPTLFPGANLRNADLSGLDLTGTDLTDADLTGATLTGAYFTDDEGATGLNLTRARLTGVTSGGIVGDATLPTGWSLINGYLVGPGANLHDADLSGADLSGADLRGVTSGGVDCTGCKLPVGWTWTGLRAGGFLVGPGADLRGADLIGADLSRADLTGALLTGAQLSRVNLSGALLRDLDLTGVDLRGSDLTGAELSRSTISGVDLTGASLTGLRSFSLVATGTPVTLPSPWLLRGGALVGPGANLSRLAFIRADFRGVQAPGVDFRGSNLTSADLTGADLTRANLTGADLTGTNLTNATLVGSRITNATVTDATFATSNDNLLAGMVSGGVVGTPRALPATGRFRVVQGYLVGPQANLAGARFTGAALLGPSLSGTNFTGADLSGLNLAGATLRNAILSNARLTGANLTGADLSNAVLDGVRSGGVVGVPSLPRDWGVVGRFLVGPRADLSGAELRGLSFRLMDLRASNLSGADLTNADFSAASLEGADLTRAMTTGTNWTLTQCPNGERFAGTPCAPVVWRGTSTVSTTQSKNGGTLLVDVGPALGGGSQWRVTVQSLTESGGWVTTTTQTTGSPGSTLRLNLPAGTYRAFVWPQHLYRSSTSGAVVLGRQAGG